MWVQSGGGGVGCGEGRGLATVWPGSLCAILQQGSV